MNFHNEENREAHRTDEYEIQQLILRRGQAFDITVTFNRDYNPNDDVIVVQFVTGDSVFLLSHFRHIISGALSNKPKISV